MNRLTRPGIDAEQTAVRFMGGEVKIQDIGDKVLELILNGPTINGVNKDTLRHLVRQLYAELKQIEDILGDNYDLDHLRGLVAAEREGRLFILQIKPGDSVYWLLEDDGWYISDPEIVADVGTKGFYLSGVRDSVEPGDNPSFIPWDEIGKSVFLSQEEAEAALAKMKEV